jgi:hypothetical protein
MVIESYWDVLEPYWSRLSIDNPEAFLASAAAAPRAVVMLYAAHFSQSEICNGGFLQFFWNSTGVLAPEACESFPAMGMPQLGAVVHFAVSRLGMPYPRRREDRWDALLVQSGRSSEELEEIFQAQDQLYLAFQEATRPLDFESLDKLFFQLIREESGGFEAVATRYAAVHAPRQNPLRIV